MSRLDLLIIGAGPAGMAAAIEARKHNLDVLVVDDQPNPGGQIWRSVELASQRDAILGQAYLEGRDSAKAFRDCGAGYLTNAGLWQLEPGFRAYVSRNQQSQVIDAKSVLLATGAQERPMPFPGWTLPGVLTVGAAQILLKTAGQIPSGSTWVVGSGPLPLLYAVQLIRAGGKITGYLDTTPSGQWWSALPHLPSALRAPGDLIKGLNWLKTLRRNLSTFEPHVRDVEAVGADRIEAVRYRDNKGRTRLVDADTLLIHEGVVPSIHIPLSAGCEMAWSRPQECFVPVLDGWGESSRENLYIAGDGAGIAGARAAVSRGTLSALRVATKAGRISEQTAMAESAPTRRQLARELAIRPFLDAMFKPRPSIFNPSDETIVCRCEEVHAREIRKLATFGRPGPNQIKAASRAGMGPCQGRQCGYTVLRILADTYGSPPADVGFYQIRPPLKPVTLRELAKLNGVNSWIPPSDEE